MNISKEFYFASLDAAYARGAKAAAVDAAVDVQRRLAARRAEVAELERELDFADANISDREREMSLAETRLKRVGGSR